MREIIFTRRGINCGIGIFVARHVIAVEVEMVIPADDPSEPFFESETVQLLRDIQEHAEQGDLAWGLDGRRIDPL